MQNIKEFLKQQGNTFHIELLTIFRMTADNEEIDEAKTLFFEYPQGTYSITLKELEKRAKKEYDRIYRKTIKKVQNTSTSNNGG